MHTGAHTGGLRALGVEKKTKTKAPQPLAKPQKPTATVPVTNRTRGWRMPPAARVEMMAYGDFNPCPQCLRAKSKVWTQQKIQVMGKGVSKRARPAWQAHQPWWRVCGAVPVRWGHLRHHTATPAPFFSRPWQLRPKLIQTILKYPVVYMIWLPHPSILKVLLSTSKGVKNVGRFLLLLVWWWFCYCLFVCFCLSFFFVNCWHVSSNKTHGLWGDKLGGFFAKFFYFF